MSRFKNRLILTAVFAALAVAGMIMNSHQMSAQQGPPDGLAVKIVGPLPVPTTGSSTVSGTVGATQSGQWNVGITGTANVVVPGGVGINGTPNVAVPGGVTISGTPTVNLAGTPSVNIANPVNSPVPVQDVAGAGQPFQFTMNANIFDKSDHGTSDTSPGPQGGKLLHIEYVSVACPVPPGNSIWVDVHTTNNGIATIPVLPSATVPGGLSVAVIGQQVSFYSDAGVYAGVSRSFTSGITSCNATIHGRQVSF